MKVLQEDLFDVYIYADDHPPPHCHVRWKNGYESVVSIQTLDLLVGNTISKAMLRTLEDNLDMLAKSWDKYNKLRHGKDKNE